jgi:hypothetical protein
MSNTHFLAAIIIPIYKPFEENSANEILSLTKAIETFTMRVINFFLCSTKKGFITNHFRTGVSPM